MNTLFTFRFPLNSDVFNESVSKTIPHGSHEGFQVVKNPNNSTGFNLEPGRSILPNGAIVTYPDTMVNVVYANPYTGMDRIDAIVIEYNHIGDPSNVAEVKIITGIPNETPAPPEISDIQLLLAYVTITSGTITNKNVYNIPRIPKLEPGKIYFRGSTQEATMHQDDTGELNVDKDIKYKEGDLSMSLKWQTLNQILTGNYHKNHTVNTSYDDFFRPESIVVSWLNDDDETVEAEVELNYDSYGNLSSRNVQIDNNKIVEAFTWESRDDNWVPVGKVVSNVEVSE